MSSVAIRSTHRALRGFASSPALVGFRPAGVALAVAAAFTLQPLALHAQPAGGTAIHGAMTTSTVGNTLIVKTINGAGTSHSAIDWISFSVPGGTKTWFDQPTVTSTSINRVTGGTRSDIFGTLGSNGRLVLVNPSGIAFGPNSSVDTAAFTASTLAMSKEDAIGGRARFAGGDNALTADGSSKIVAREGDVVLIASNVNTGAQVVVESSGSTILAAGQKVEITGRGLEGIRMQVQAGNQAVNLGTLKGDAVGIFAGTLRHTGIVQAQAVSAAGGKVVLQSTGGDTLVSGSITAGGSAGKGGKVDVLGERVALLAGAAIDASGINGGGTVRVGGDYQGKNGDVPNAKRTYVDAKATIKADAIQQGDGGRVIVWSDEFTRMAGQISARGGALGGNGGFAEVSGKKQLEYTGLTDLRAPKGAAGSLLLDPENVTIVHSTSIASTNTFPSSVGAPANSVFFEPSSTGNVTISDAHLNAQLGSAHVQVKTSSSVSSGTGGQITLASGADVNWASAYHLSLLADQGITLNGQIHASNVDASLHLQALNGDIVSTAGSVIDVPALAAFAANTGTSIGTGGKILLSGATQVGVFAAKADGVGAEVKVTAFSPRGTEPEVTIGNVYNNWGSVAGIGGDGDNPVTVSLTSTAGNLRLANTNINGGTISLTTAAGGELHVDNSYISGQSVTLTSGAGGDVRLSGYSGVNANSGDVTITSGRDFLVGSTSGYYASVHSSGGGVTITAAGAVRVGEADVSAYVDISGDGVSIAANGGDAYFGYGASINSGFKPLTVTAKTNILGGGIFRSEGSSLADGSASAISLTANAGKIEFGDITTNGVNSSGSFSSSLLHGGKVTLTARQGSVTGNSISSLGGFADVSTGGRGGDVTIAATGGDISVGTIDASGGNGLPGGKGGTVKMTATGDILLSPNSQFAIRADGGDSGFSQGGNGGTIDLQAGGSILVQASTSSSCGAGCGGLSAIGGFGIAPTTASGPDVGGKGGRVVLTAGSDVSVPLVEAYGGGGSRSVAGEPGAEGGKVEVHFGNTFAGEVRAFGGEGGTGSGSGGAGGQGGKGGSIWLERTATGQALTLGGNARLYANGGQGGRAYGDGVGTPGTGGDGGSITLSSAGGGVILQDGIASVATGFYGTDAYGNTFSNETVTGQFVPLGNVDVQGSFDLDGTWVNTAAVDLTNAGYVFGYGTFRNQGTVNLHDETSMRPGQVYNTGTINSISGTSEVTVTSNTGVINVQAGTTLNAHDFVANDGTLNVNGTLDVLLASECDCQLTTGAAAISGPTFANNGRINGTGTVAIQSGSGTLENFGVIAPGGSGPVGTLNISGNLLMASGSALAVDLGAPGAPGTAGTSDLLVVSGNATTGGTVSASAAFFDKGDFFTVLQAASFDGVMPTVNLPQLTPTFGPNSVDFSLVGNAVYPPLQTPEVNSQIVIFSQLFIQESERQQQQDKKENQIGKDDIVVTDTACKPS